MTPEDRSAANRRVAEWMGWHDEEYENVWQGGVDRYWRLIDHEGCRMEVACCSPEEAWASHNIPDLWADSPEGAAWRWRVMEKLIKSGWYLQVDDRYIDMGHFYVVFRQWGSPKVADALYPSLTEAMAMALHAAVVALEGEEVR